MIMNTHGLIGRSSGSEGTVTVTGAGSRWTSSSELYVGSSGTGTLTVADGGHVSTATLFADTSDLYGDGTISVKGLVLDHEVLINTTQDLQQTVAFGSGGKLELDLDGSGALGAGHRGSGTLTISGGVEVASTSGVIGNRSGSEGAVTITGAGSTWTSSGSLTVGHFGTGTLTVAGGAHVSAGTLFASASDLYGDGTIAARGIVLDHDVLINKPQQTIAFGSGGELQVDLDGGGTLGAGYRGSGTLMIAGGVAVASGSGLIGQWSGSEGTVTVTGAGSRWTSSDALFIGGSDFGAGGTGSLAVRNGASMNVGRDLWIGSGTLHVGAGGSLSSTDGHVGRNSFSEAVATITGGNSTWTLSGLLHIGGEPGQGSGTSTLTVAEGGHVQAAEVVISGGGRVHGDATLTADTIVNRGLIAPGLPGTPDENLDPAPGTLTLAGDYDQHAFGTLRIGIAGNLDHSRLFVDGDVSFAGTLEIVALGGVQLGTGDTFQVLDWTGTHDGSSFDTIMAPDLDTATTGLAWSFDQLYSDGRITIVLDMLPGDMNLDGVVDTADVAPFVLALTDPAAYQSQFGVDEATMIAAGDINQDGAFDTADVAPFVQLLVGGDTSVPEPGSLAPLGLGALVLLGRRVR